MKNPEISTYRIIGILLILGAVGVMIPYTLLTMTFDYPDVLRQDTGVVLTKFHNGGNPLIWTWFAFGISGLPLLPALIMLGKSLKDQSRTIGVATTLGVIGLVVQMIGLLRWTFVVPVLADTYVNAPDEGPKTAVVVAFKLIHQFGGVLLGEHLGQLFTVIWTVLLTHILSQKGVYGRWFIILGYLASAIYFLAQGELLATVMPGFPHWDLAGAIGSTLWLIWLVILGIVLMRKSHFLSFGKFRSAEAH